MFNYPSTVRVVRTIVISMVMLFLQKLAGDSGKNPHHRAIEKACIMKHF
jgi:hypothetical protein